MQYFQKKRIMLLLISSGLLIGAGVYWISLRPLAVQTTAVLPANFFSSVGLFTAGFKLPTTWPWQNDKPYPAIPETAKAGNNATVAANSANKPIENPQQYTESAERSNKIIAATTRAMAETNARLRAGRTDPFVDVNRYQPFPRENRIETDRNRIETERPITSQNGPMASAGRTPAVADKPPSVPLTVPALVERLPDPPTKPTVSDKMQLVGVIGDHVLLSVRQQSSKVNKLPSSLTLGKGEKFDSLSVVDVTNDSVTLDEDGQQTVKTIAPIRRWYLISTLQEAQLSEDIASKREGN